MRGPTHAPGEPALDRHLLRRAQAGDSAAFDELVAQHGPLVLSLARSITRHREDAEDVAQEVFVRLYRTIARVDPERPLEPWLVRITVNAARSFAARSPRRREEALDPATETAKPSDDPGRRLEGSQFQSALQEAAGALSEREREVFLLRDVQGLEVSVIAEALQVAEVTVRRQSSDGRRKILAWFQKHRPEFLSPDRRDLPGGQRT